MILLLGDSITQMGSNEYDGTHGGWVAHMQAHYNRRVRVGRNRAFVRTEHYNASKASNNGSCRA